MNTYTFGMPDADIVLVQPVDEHGLRDLETEFRYISEKCKEKFCLRAFLVRNWNEELSPWEAPPVFGNKGFGSGAAGTLEAILGLCGDPGRTYILGGYSLAGLFSLWAAYRTDAFTGIAAASPSLWFPGFLEYMRRQEPKTREIYLSLGDKEEKTGNPVMATVGDRIREAHALLCSRDVNCRLEWNPGNHFRDTEIRTAGAFAWVINNIQYIDREKNDVLP